MFLQLERPPLNRPTQLSNQLGGQSIHSFNSPTRPYRFNAHGEPMSQSTRDRHASTPIHDGNTTAPLNQNPNQQADALSVIVVDESCITRFNYWDQGICQGMRLNQELYTCFQCFTSALRFKAYDVGHAFVEKGIAVCISVSEMGYCVWLNLRSLSTEMGAEINSQIRSKLSSQPSF